MIDKLYNIIFSTKFLKWAIGVFLVFYFFSLYHRYIQQDEPWFGEQAYWLLKEGQVKLKSMPGVFSWTENMLIYHKLFVWIGAALIAVFGWSLYTFKIFILIVYSFSCWLIIKFLKQYKNSDTSLRWLAILLLVITPELIHRSFMFRPEVVVMCFGFLSFYMLYKTLEENRNYAHWAGLFSGLAFLTHLNALLFPVAGFLLLFFFKKWRLLILYTLICGAVCSVYTIGLWSEGNLQTYLYEMQNWPTHQKAFGDKVEGGFIGIIWNNIVRLLNEHKRYFWDQDVWMISILFILSLITHFKYLWRQHRIMFGYTLIVMVLLGVLSSGHSPRYLVYQMPLMVLVIALVIQKMIGEKKALLKVLFLIVFTAQLAITGITFKKIYQSNYDHVEVHAEILSNMESGSRILAPWEFIYNQIDQYHIFSYKTYEYIEDQEKIKLSQKELFTLAADKFAMDYIVIDRNAKENQEFPWFYNWEIVENPYYEEYWRNENYLILKKK